MSTLIEKHGFYRGVEDKEIIKILTKIQQIYKRHVESQITLRVFKTIDTAYIFYDVKNKSEHRHLYPKIVNIQEIQQLQAQFHNFLRRPDEPNTNQLVSMTLLVKHEKHFFLINYQELEELERFPMIEIVFTKLCNFCGTLDTAAIYYPPTYYKQP